jgi:hypothetical protein
MTNIQLLTTAGQDEIHLILRLTLLGFIKGTILQCALITVGQRSSQSDAVAVLQQVQPA